MSRVDAILDHAGNPERIDQLVRRVHGLHSHRGWVLADGEVLADQVWVHARPFLMDAGGPAGLRRDRRSDREATGWGLLSDLEERSGYSLVVLRPASGWPSPEVLELLERAQKTQVLYVVLQADGNPGQLRFLDREGRSQPLPVPKPVYSETIPLRLKGKRLIQGAYLLPLTAAVTVREPRGRLEVAILGEGSGFQPLEYGFLLENPTGEEIGSGRLTLDVAFDTLANDDGLVLRPVDFPAPLHVQTFAGKVPTPGTSPAGQRWRVHVLFDRTTLDVDQWPMAAWSSFQEKGGNPGGGIDSGLVHAQPTTSPPPLSFDLSGTWNLGIRRSLATALAQLDSSTPGVEIHLWWFADVPRNGIERHPILDSAPNSFNPCGRCPASRLAEILQDDQFGYRPGLDVYDAVDEALAGMAAAFRGETAREIRQAVIVVGDSPPPPQDVADPLWKEIPGRPVVTNARTSPDFRQALQDLAALQVPVGWLFVRSPRSPTPSPDVNLLKMGEGYAAFQALKEKVLRVLQGIAGLITVETDTEDELVEPLLRLATLLGGSCTEIAPMDVSLDPRKAP